MKKRELENILSVINGMVNLQGVKFSYAVAKNRNKIVSEIDIIKKLLQPSAEFIKYEEKRIKLCQDYALKDEKGNFIFSREGNYNIGNKTEFDKEIEKLQREYKKEIDLREKLRIDIEIFLDEDVNIKWHMIPMDIVPDNITPKEMSAIIEFVEE